MKCPVCNQEMKQVRQDVSYNPDEGNKEYDRVVYHCEADGAWGNTEIPKTDLNN